jgi:hypothetical protein
MELSLLGYLVMWDCILRLLGLAPQILAIVAQTKIAHDAATDEVGRDLAIVNGVQAFASHVTDTAQVNAESSAS